MTSKIKLQNLFDMIHFPVVTQESRNEYDMFQINVPEIF